MDAVTAAFAEVLDIIEAVVGQLSDAEVATRLAECKQLAAQRNMRHMRCGMLDRFAPPSC
jgi:hypothetical protein